MRITKENLTRYDQHFKSWQRRRLGYGKALENWKQTEEAGAVQFYPVGGSPLEGKVKFSFTETPPASGDKSSSNPSQIAGVTQAKVTRCGKNICPRPYENSRTAPAGAVFNVQADGGIAISGVQATTTNSHFVICQGYVVLLKAGCTYTASLAFSSGVMGIVFQGYNAGGIVFTASYNDKRTFTPEKDTPVEVCVTVTPTAAGTLNTTVYPQLELGSAATAFEPYEGADYTIDLGNTYYGGEIDLATGLMTVTWENLAVTGSEAWQSFGEQAAGIYSYALVRNFNADGGATGNGDVCSHFVYDNGAGEKIVSWHHSKKYIYVYSSISSLSDFKAWLATQLTAGTPVEFCFQSNTPTTASVTPTEILSLAQTYRREPRLNTVYTDADSIQITYQKSPIRAATEQEMAILGLGGNV